MIITCHSNLTTDQTLWPTSTTIRWFETYWLSMMGMRSTDSSADDNELSDVRQMTSGFRLLLSPVIKTTTTSVKRCKMCIDLNDVSSYIWKVLISVHQNHPQRACVYGWQRLENPSSRQATILLPTFIQYDPASDWVSCCCLMALQQLIVISACCCRIITLCRQHMVMSRIPVWSICMVAWTVVLHQYQQK